MFSITGIYPQMSSKGGAHGSQGDDSTYLARTGVAMQSSLSKDVSGFGSVIFYADIAVFFCLT